MKLGWCFEYALVHNHYMRRGRGRQGHSLDRLAIDTCICLTAYKSRHFAIVETIPLELSGEDGVLLIVISTGFLGTKHAGESCFAVQQCHAAESLHFLTSMCIISAAVFVDQMSPIKSGSMCYQPIIAGAKSSTIEMGRGSSIVI